MELNFSISSHELKNNKIQGWLIIIFCALYNNELLIIVFTNKEKKIKLPSSYVKDIKTQVSKDLNFPHHKVPGLDLLSRDYAFIMTFL